MDIPQTDFYECNPANILDEFDNFLSAEVDCDEFEGDEEHQPIKQSNMGLRNRHKKHDSDCTIIDTNLQDMEALEDLNKKEIALNESKLSSVEIEEEITPVVNLREITYNSNNFVANLDEVESGKGKSESHIFSNFVSFIRINSLRFKKSINKDNNDEKTVNNDRVNDKTGEGETENSMQFLASQSVSCQENEITRFGFEEMCKPSQGMLRKSGSGPITFHRTTTEVMLGSNIDFDQYQTFPRRTFSKFDNGDSGFESCNSYSLRRSYERTKRKKAVPLLQKNNSQNQAEYPDDFHFRDSESPNSVISIEAILPALADVSDDEMEDKPQMFFGRFQGKERLQLKTEKDLYQTQTKFLEFSDSDEEPLIESNDSQERKSKLLISMSRSSSSGSSASKEEIRKILSGRQSILDSTDDKEMEIIVSPFPGDTENLQTLISSSIDSVEMVCENNLEHKVMTGKLFLWTPDFKKKIKKVFLNHQRSGHVTPEGSVKLINEKGIWSLCAPSSLSGDPKTAIYLTMETDTERSESVSTTATSPLYEEDGDKKFNSQEELYFNIREQMKTLDQDINHTPNQDDLPYIVIDYMNHDRI